jgi:hypothetical protein
VKHSAVIGVFLGAVLSACGATTSSGTGGKGGAAGQGGNAGGGGAPGTGGASGGGNGCSGGASGAGSCGIDSLGQESCACQNGKVVNCACPRPATWTALGGECGDAACATEGGPCSPQGYASSATAPKGGAVLDGQPCVMNGNVCFTAEAGASYGCVCASTPSGDFVMRCGPVNGWFTDNGTPTTY